MTESITQKTIGSVVDASGIGLFTGEVVSLRMRPAPENSGIVFRRIDLPNKPEIPAKIEYVKNAPRCTRLATENGSVQTVEHILSALSCYGIDNVKIDVGGAEILAADGSSQLFVELIEKAGIVELPGIRTPLKIEEPIFWTEGDIHIVALPANELRVSYTLHYPNSKLLRSQYYSFLYSPEKFKKEIAPARTFSIYEEILPFIESGIIKGGGLENALVIREDRIINTGGARFPEEMARHKILDLLGDLSLIGQPILGHIISIRSGHASNVSFAKHLMKHMCVTAGGCA